MTETIDHLIRARFDRVANPSDDADWSDVLARAGSVRRTRRAPARLAVAAAVAALAATLTAVAFGWPGTVVDFFEAPPAQQSVKAFFGAHHLGIPGGVSPETKLGQPREIMTATFDADDLPPQSPTLHTLYVAPRDDGGFCYLWTGYGGGCADPEDPARARTNPAARSVGISDLENDYVGFVDGWMRGDAKTLEVHFARGATATIPVTWVSAPIDAGFFAYVVPPSHLTRADPLTSIVALDATGEVVRWGRQPFELTKPLDEDVEQTLPDGRKIALPRRAQASRAHELFSFPAARHSRAYLWAMPRTGGGVCFLYGTGGGGGFGCPSRYWLAHIPAIDGNALNGVYFAQVKPEIAMVELDFRNGSSERIKPIDGFVLHAIPFTPVSVVGLSPTGKPIFTQELR
jgi:hypothetical protein